MTTEILIILQDYYNTIGKWKLYLQYLNILWIVIEYQIARFPIGWRVMDRLVIDEKVGKVLNICIQPSLLVLADRDDFSRFYLIKSQQNQKKNRDRWHEIIRFNDSEKNSTKNSISFDASFFSHIGKAITTCHCPGTLIAVCTFRPSFLFSSYTFSLGETPPARTWHLLLINIWPTMTFVTTTTTRFCATHRW